MKYLESVVNSEEMQYLGSAASSEESMQNKGDAVSWLCSQFWEEYAKQVGKPLTISPYHHIVY